MISTTLAGTFHIRKENRHGQLQNREETKKIESGSNLFLLIMVICQNSPFIEITLATTACGEGDF